MPGRQQPLLREIVYDVLKQAGRPMRLAEITQEVLRVRPSKAKRPELSSLLREQILGLEEGEEFSETFDPSEHWMDLLRLDIVEADLAEGNLVFRFNFASALGNFTSADEVAITTEEEMAEKTLSLIRQRYLTIVRALLRQNPSMAEIKVIELTPEDAVEDMMDFFAEIVDAKEDFAQGTLSDWEMARLQEAELDFVGLWDEGEEEEWWW